MGIILGALAGAGRAAGEIADSNIKLWNDQDMQAKRFELETNREKMLIDMREQAVIRHERRGVEASDAARDKMVGAIDTGASKIVRGRMDAGGNGIADPSTWTPEQEAARNQGIIGTAANDPRARARAAANAGYTDEASKLDKIAENNAFTLRPYEQRFDSEGNPIATADAFGKEQARLAEIAARGEVNAAGKAGRKADHFDEKQWDAAFKPDKSIVSVPNAMGDKDIESAELRVAYKNVFNQARTSGNYAPNEANEYASTTVLRLKSAAAARVQAATAKDPKSTMTIDQAVRDIMKEASAYQPKPSAASSTGYNGGSRDAANAESIRIIESELATARPEDIPGLKREIARLKAQSPVAPPATATTKATPAAAPAKTTVEPAPEYEALKAQAKALDAKIAELRRDYNQATSVNGRRGLAPGVADRIKARLESMIAQQAELESKAEASYRAADRGIIASRGKDASASLNDKYAQ